MADISKMYSYKKGYPGVLPNRIRLSDGSTKTDNKTFTDSDIADAGYIVAPDQPSGGLNYQANVKKVGDSAHILFWNDSDWGWRKPTDQETNEQWEKVRQMRDNCLQNDEWAVARNRSEVRLGLTPTDNISKLDSYFQSLRDITKQKDPFDLKWPEGWDLHYDSAPNDGSTGVFESKASIYTSGPLTGALVYLSNEKHADIPPGDTSNDDPPGGDADGAE